MSYANTRRERLAALAEKTQIDAVLLTAPPSVTCFSGYYFYFEYGPSPFHLIPAALLVVPGRNTTLIVADNEVHQTASLSLPVAVRAYQSYTYTAPLAAAKSFLNELKSAWRSLGLTSPRLGVEKQSLSVALIEGLREEFPDLTCVDVTREVAAIRAVKDQDEIVLIREAAHLSDIAQRSVMEHACPDISEIDLFHIVRHDIDVFAGKRVPLMADLSAGVNASSGGGMPTGKVIKKGELVLSDFTPCLNGYWGDSCSTIVVGGKPTAEQRRIFSLVQEALAAGIAEARPGALACEVDAAMRACLKGEGSFDHHGGHGVGTQYHEEPRIAPYNQMVIEPGMVIALEPAVYKPDFGIRLEHLIVVKAERTTLLTKFKHSLEPR